MKHLLIHTLVTLEYFNFKRENKFERFVIYFYIVIPAAEQLLEETMKHQNESGDPLFRTSRKSKSRVSHRHNDTIIHLTARSISECITTNTICSLIPHPKHW